VTDSLQPYPEYKDSGQTWLGQVPRHWPVLPNRAIFDEVKDRAHPDEEMLSVTITRGIVRQKALLADSSKKDSSNLNKSAYKLVQPRDIAYNKMRAWQGAIAASDLRGIISPAYVVMRLREDANLPRYFHHLYRTPLFAKEAERWSYGITSDMWSLRPEHFKVIYTPLPPPSEQAAIVRFLDHAHGRIDRAIRAKRKIITLLNEQKQAIIHRAVTRGLDPSVPLKPSGIPWLGDIPQHWEVRRLRTLANRIEQGVSPLAVGFLAEGDSWGVLKSGCVNRGVFRETEHKQLAKAFQIDPSIVVKVGDVLISRACGSPSLVGSVGKVESLKYRLILSDKTFRVVFCPLVDVDFMVYAMNSRYYRDQVEQAISGAEGMANNLPLSSLRDFVFAIPPRSEASAIAQHLCDTHRESTTAISNFEREITLLREYRTRLTADVVTGKLDVRAAAASLPDPEPVEPIPSVSPDEPDAADDPDLEPEEAEA
jgi:type I restriction enzyme S subunit